MKKRASLFLFIAVCLFIQMIFLVSSAEKATNIIANSNDWRDVYSIVHYSNLVGATSDFIVGERSGAVLLKDISKGSSIRVISSSKNNIIINYGGYVQSQKFNSASESSLDNVNLELIDELPEINNFIIVGDQYGYNAVATVPYAVLTRSWVFFANRANIAEIDSILSNRNINKLMIYGYVDPEVNSVLGKYNPEIIDNNDRFKDNVKIVQKYMEISPVKQIVFTNGEFIEKEIMAGAEPVLFTGRDNTPEEIGNYIKDADIDVGVLVGADLVGAATNIRRTTGISVIVKFARGARDPVGAISSVEGIDTFPIPVPIMNLDIYSLKYNQATSVIEVTYNSSSNIPVYLKGSINLEDDTGKKLKIGDVDPVFVAPNSYKTITYSDVDFTGSKITASIFTLYGETSAALEKILQKTLTVGIVNVVDNCKIDINELKYNVPKKIIFVSVTNPSNLDCWVQAELKEVNIGGRLRTISSVSSIDIKSGTTQSIPISQELSDSDLAKNSLVDTTVYFGERKDSLIKKVNGKFTLGIEKISFVTISMIILAIIVLFIIFFLIILLRRRKKDEWS